MQLVVTAKRLNKRSSPPVSFADNNIIGTVFQGFRFNGTEITGLPDQSLGRWYRDANGSCYWGGGLVAEQEPVNFIRLANNNPIVHLPDNFWIGADLSHHNADPDWATLISAQIRFVYIKISEGVGTPDLKAREYANNARDNNIKIGYYHFGRPDKRNGGTVETDAVAEADEAINIIASLPKPDLPLVLDLEDEEGWDTPLVDKAEYLIWIQTFVSQVASRTGISPIIYSRKEYLDSKLPADHDLGKCKLWIANYSQQDCDAVSCPAGWRDWSIWQFSEKSSLGGDNTKLDLSILKDLTFV